MIIYLDVIFIENLIIDYILLKETAFISRKDICNKNTLFSAIIASSYIVIMAYLKIRFLDYIFCKILIITIIIYISFKPKKIKEYVKIIMLFLLISVINVGSVTLFSNLFNLQNAQGLLKIGIYIISLVVSRMFAYYMWQIYKREIKNEDLIYTVKIKLNKKRYEYKAFMDTGNNVYSYTEDVPVIFAELLDDDISEELKRKEYFYINTVTLSKEVTKKAYVFDNVEIFKNEKRWMAKAAIVFENNKFARDNSYNMILNYFLYTDKIGGIRI